MLCYCQLAYQQCFWCCEQHCTSCRSGHQVFLAIQGHGLHHTSSTAQHSTDSIILEAHEAQKQLQSAHTDTACLALGNNLRAPILVADVASCVWLLAQTNNSTDNTSPESKDSSTRQLPLNSTMSQVALPGSNTTTSPGTRRWDATALHARSPLHLLYPDRAAGPG